MQDFFLYISTAFALIFVIEGLLYACFPETMRRILATALMLPKGKLRHIGFSMFLFGVFLVLLMDRVL
ncbi:MAG: hypothetical protein CL565_05225 [Alphaproteobacteria bacterium]|nr:hypothetical protein [Alphaproteobacteria bacterium]|tara:strand:+ start:240 stop:443 length:204 start_codon:yes stop_codon:yes gene_type:complete